MAKLNLSQAAKVVGKNRTTIWRHINSGKLSSERDRDGQPFVDTSELIRVYGELKQPATHEKNNAQHKETPSYEELILLVKEMKKEQSEMKSLIIDMGNRLGYTPDNMTLTTANQHELATCSKPENDLRWPKEIKTMADIALRDEIKSKYLPLA